MSTRRRLRRYVDDLLSGRRPRPFQADEQEAAEVDVAITLRTARPSSGAPATSSSPGCTGGSPPSRRRAPRVYPMATRRPNRPPPGAGSCRSPRPRRRSAPPRGRGRGGGRSRADRAERCGRRADAPAEHRHVAHGGGRRRPARGAVRQFDVGSVIGFVTRTSGQLLAVSGFCSHLHCRLSLDSAKRELLCPCHRTAFTVGGEVVRFQLAVPPPSLPHIVVREVDGDIQVLAP
ncbi:ubiquinol-cytochrome c reductase iron-sulfur subunit [Phytohabitans flavus]|uniref:QcrA and Rieske domain-containing protein n=1 Tax=Phytohabitans flavus TaxID=1076124 RepID=UPI0036404676